MRQLPSVVFPLTFHARQCVALLLLFAPARLLAQTQAATPAQTQGQTIAATHAPQKSALHIRVLNARTNKPVPDERLNIWLRPDQIGSVPAPTDKNGDIFLDTHDATTIRVLANFYADCRPRGELYTDYPIATIRSTGIAGGSNCGGVSRGRLQPGQLLLFVIPKTYIRTMGQPPVTNLPHSDENPNQ